MLGMMSEPTLRGQMLDGLPLCNATEEEAVNMSPITVVTEGAAGRTMRRG